MLATEIDGKPFNLKKERNDETHYGEVIFAEAVVRANVQSVDFSGFEELLSRIQQVLEHYQSLIAASEERLTLATAGGRP